MIKVLCDVIAFGSISLSEVARSNLISIFFFLEHRSIRFGVNIIDSIEKILVIKYRLVNYQSLSVQLSIYPLRIKTIQKFIIEIVTILLRERN